MFCANAWLALGGMPIFWTLLSTTAMKWSMMNDTGQYPCHQDNQIITTTKLVSQSPALLSSAIYGESTVGHEWIHDLDIFLVVSILQPTDRRCRRSSSCLWLLCHLLFMLRQHLEAYSHIEARNTIQCTIGSHSHPSQHPPTNPQNFPTDLCLWAHASNITYNPPAKIEKSEAELEGNSQYWWNLVSHALFGRRHVKAPKMIQHVFKEAACPAQPCKSSRWYWRDTWCKDV